MCSVVKFQFWVLSCPQCPLTGCITSLINFHSFYRFWRGLYNRFDRGMHPRQSVEDYLRAIQEETQQLEGQLTSHKQVRRGPHIHTERHFLWRGGGKLHPVVAEDDYSFVSHMTDRKLLSWSRSRDGMLPPSTRAPRCGLSVTTSLWPTLLRTTPADSSPAAPTHPKHRTVTWSSCRRTRSRRLTPASPTAATRSLGLQTWAAVRLSVRTAPEIRIPMRLPTLLPEQI